jgi:hypothetical protein
MVHPHIPLYCQAWHSSHLWTISLSPWRNIKTIRCIKVWIPSNYLACFSSAMLIPFMRLHHHHHHHQANRQPRQLLPIATASFYLKIIKPPSIKPLWAGREMTVSKVAYPSNENVMNGFAQLCWQSFLELPTMSEYRFSSFTYATTNVKLWPLSEASTAFSTETAADKNGYYHHHIIHLPKFSTTIAKVWQLS